MTDHAYTQQKRPIPPPLTDAQRQLAWDRSVQVRQAQAGLRASVSEGTVRLDEAMNYDWAGTMKVRLLLESVPFIKKKQVARILDALSIGESKHISGLGKTQRLALLRMVAQVQSEIAHSKHQKLLAAERKAEENASQ